MCPAPAACLGPGWPFVPHRARLAGGRALAGRLAPPRAHRHAPAHLNPGIRALGGVFNSFLQGEDSSSHHTLEWLYCYKFSHSLGQRKGGWFRGTNRRHGRCAGPRVLMVCFGEAIRRSRHWKISESKNNSLVYISHPEPSGFKLRSSRQPGRQRRRLRPGTLKARSIPAQPIRLD
jgi:hypothetical protein